MENQFSHGHPDHDACGTGFIVKLDGAATHEVVNRALVALQRLSHRGGVDADASSGDGAGLLTAIPRRIISHAARNLRVPLPRIFGLGMLFIQPGEEGRVQGEIAKLAAAMELRCLGWRPVPTNLSVVGARAAETAPSVWQCFMAATHAPDIERQLFLFRKRAEAELSDAAYFCSLSSRTVVYKGLLAPWQLPDFYADLRDREFETQFAIFHQRFSTNTQPTWRLAQPFRVLAHNGEINTITGNRRWMTAREQEIRSRLNAGLWFHALESNVSDSASLDNAIELLAQQGESMNDALLSLVPPAVGANSRLEPQIAEKIETAACEYEPWDGPAALVFSDGQTLGAKLDRNGLRPMRYTRTSTGWLVAGSETGLADFDEKHVIERQRLGPGEALLVDIASGRVFPRGACVAETKGSKRSAMSKPLRRLLSGTDGAIANVADPRRVAAALGWSGDQIDFLLQPLAQGKEPVYSMGDDAPPAFLSKMRRTLWDYCKQRFAQVTNPPIDPLREAHVMSLDARIGPDCIADSPLLDGQQMRALEESFTDPQRLDITFNAAPGVTGALQALERIRKEVQWSPGPAPSLVIVSDRGVDERRLALPVLLAVAAIWKEMVQGGHFRVPLVVETAQVIETHHVALLLAVGATAVQPYLAQQLAEEQVEGGARNHGNAIKAGLRKVMSRMGISTLASYRNGQLFEVIGLDEQVCEEFFESAPHWAEAVTLQELLGDYQFNHATAFQPDFKAPADAGLYRFRKQGEKHATSADLLRKLHAHIKNPDAAHYSEFESLAVTREPVAIRDLLEFVPAEAGPRDSVEPEAEIVKRFSVQAMSVGAISPEAHRTLALAMNELGARSNTGEGGEDPEIYLHMPEAACRIKQVASARFGVTAEYLVNAQEIEIKIAQGSKPGEGGQLPASKVTAYIARLRHAVPGMALISPPPHHDIYSIEDLEQLIHDLRQINPAARIGVKLVAGAGVGIIAAGVAKAGADVITISGFDGGTGASPLSSIKNTGLPWEFGLRDAHKTLIKAGLRQNVRLRVDGGMKFARDVVTAALLGADEFGFGTAALLAMGCVMARQCHLNTCPVGIATQDESLRTRFAGRPEMVKDYFRAVATETRVLLGRLGARSLAELTGHTELLQPRNQEAHQWVRGLLETTARVPDAIPRGNPRRELSRRLLELSKTAGRITPPVFRIVNADRSIGAELTGERLRQRSITPLAIHFQGTAGQSFGAFLGAGLSFHLGGAANDYVAKGLSGGTVAITAGSEASRRGDVLAGNTVLYGATSGELYMAGQAGERFAVRNSGAISVVEGAGDHACEYMTGGVVVILGPTGINLGSGMTGGLTYLLSDHSALDSCNADFVRLAICTSAEERAVRQLLIRHWILTRSPKAILLLESGRPLPLTRIQPLVLPCPVEDTWKPVLQRLEHVVLSGLHCPSRPGKHVRPDFPTGEVSASPQSLRTTSGAAE